ETRCRALPFAGNWRTIGHRGAISVAEQVQIVFIPSPTAPRESALNFSGPNVASPIFTSGDDDTGGDDDTDRGGTIGSALSMNIIETFEFRSYLARLEPNDPVTFARVRLRPEDFSAAREVGVAVRRHVVLVDRSSL